MKHPLDHRAGRSGRTLQRVIDVQKTALPQRASLMLQQRPRTPATARRMIEFLRISRITPADPAWR